MAEGDTPLRNLLFPSSWERLTFDGSGTFSTITTEVQIKCPDDVPDGFFTKKIEETSNCAMMGQHMNFLSVDTTVRYMIFFRENYTENVLFDAITGQACLRIRQYNGKDSWIKTYAWTRDGIKRQKISPASPDEKKQFYVKWTQRSQSIYPYPSKSRCLLISDPPILFYVLSVLDYNRLQLPLELCVFGKKQYHRLTIAAQASFPITVSFKTNSPSGENRVKAKLKPLVFSVSAEPVMPSTTKPEKFSLLGLQKDICIYIDQFRRLPIRITGINDKLGNLLLNLSDAELK